MEAHERLPEEGHGSGVRAVIGCHCEHCEQGRRMARNRQKLRAVGQPAMIDGPLAEMAFRKVRSFHARGMSSHDIARQVDLAQSTITDMIKGVRSDGFVPVGLHRSTYDKIFALQWAEPASFGPPVPPEGTRRRLQALSYKGFGLSALAEETGCGRVYCGRVTLGRSSRAFVHFDTYRRVRDAYERLKDTDPADHPLCTPYNIARVTAAARRNGYAPPECWDDDTLDDPMGIPEWTGMCGTLKGYFIHVRDGIPVCVACAHKRVTQRKSATKKEK